MPTLEIPIAASGDDRGVRRDGSAWPVTSSDTLLTETTRNNGDYGQKTFAAGPTYRVGNLLRRFLTSSLPSSAINVTAVYRFYVQGFVRTNGLSVCADYYTWDGTSADWQPTAQSSAVDPVAHTSFTLNAWADLTLKTPDVSLNRSGYTYLRFHTTDPGSAPTGGNYIDQRTYDYDAANGTDQKPRLIVSYTDVDPPANPTGLTASLLGA